MSSRGLAAGRRRRLRADPKPGPRSGPEPHRPPGRSVSVGLLAGALLGALLLLVAEFTTLFELKTTAGGAAIRSIGTGSHHAYAFVPVGLLVAFLALGVWRVGSRPALLAIGVLGVLALLIGLLGDLPDAHQSGLVAIASGHYANATATPNAGLYLETLGAVVLVITSVCGFLMLGPPVPAARRPSAPADSAPASEAS